MAHSFDTEAYNRQVNAVWRATLWLSIITVVEVAIALIWMYKVDPGGHSSKIFINSFFVVASLLKAFFIVGEFMHVRYETRALTLTILVPLVFLIWFIIAFLWEGAEWLDNREFWGTLFDQAPKAPIHH